MGNRSRFHRPVAPRSPSRCQAERDASGESSEPPAGGKYDCGECERNLIMQEYTATRHAFLQQFWKFLAKMLDQ
jgi:hypothetical protein